MGYAGCRMQAVVRTWLHVICIWSVVVRVLPHTFKFCTDSRGYNATTYVSSCTQ